MLASDLSYRLSDHFILAEAVRSSTAARLGIDNRPPIELLPALSTVATRILEPCRDYFNVPIRPSSWYRGEDLERAICWGGRDDSAFGRWCRNRKREINDLSWAVYFAAKQHPTGNAVDFEVARVSNIELATYIRDNLAFDQLILEFYDPDDPVAGWVHASYVAQGKNRQQVLTIGRGFVREGLPEIS